jgi:GTP-binding protein
VVAIVGRPNVGKSTLFNRLIGQRLAIVEDVPGTTRDRVYATADWNGRDFRVVDTGGLELDPGTSIEARVQDQARVAMEEADVILFVVDAAAGLAPLDYEVADRLRRASS